MLKLKTICHEGVRLTSGELPYTETCFLLLGPLPLIKIRQRQVTLASFTSAYLSI
jgi:hypothetical protein